MFHGADDSQRTTVMITTTSVRCIFSLILLWSKSNTCSQDRVFHPFMWSQQNTLWTGTHYEQTPIYCSFCFALKDRDEVVQTDTWHFDSNLMALAPTFKRSKESLQFFTAFSNIQVWVKQFFCFVLMVFFIIFIKSGTVMEMRVPISFPFKQMILSLLPWTKMCWELLYEMHAGQESSEYLSMFSV